MGFCPRCGGILNDGDGRSRNRSVCSVCGFVVHHNPAPVVVAAVVDGDRVLFVKRRHSPNKRCWSLPGGYMEMDEAPEVGAARELSEETGLRVDPSDMTFIGTIYEPIGEGQAVVDIVLAVPFEKAMGDLVAGDEAAALEFWTREEIESNSPVMRVGDSGPILEAIDHFGGRRPDDRPIHRDHVAPPW